MLMTRPNIFRTIVHHPLILPLYLPAFIFSFSQYLLVPILPLYVKNFGISYGLVGVVLAGEGLGTLLGDVPAGVLLRRLGKKWAMLLGVGIAALTTGALFRAHSIPEALTYRLLSGFGMALFNIARHTYLADMIRVTSRGRAIALYGGIARVGRFIGPAAGGFIAGAYGLRAPFLVFGGVGLLVLTLMALFVRRTKSAAPGMVSPPPVHKGQLLGTLKAHRRVLTTAGAGQLFAQMIRAGRTVIIPLYAADIIGLDVQAIGLIISIAAALEMTLFYPAGLLMDHRGRKFAIVPCFATQAIGMALIPLSGSFAGLLAVALLIAFGNGLGSGTMMTLGADLAPPKSRGEFLGVWRLIGDSGFTGAPLVVGAVADLVVLPAAALAMSGAGFTAVMIFALLVPETLRKKAAGSRMKDKWSNLKSTN